MKKIFLFLFLCFWAYADTVYYACVDLNTQQIISTWVQDSSEEVKSVDRTKRTVFMITQAEYEGTIQQATIEAAITANTDYLKNINNISKLEKCGFLVIMDYLRSLGLSKTNVQFRNDVITKYDNT